MLHKKIVDILYQHQFKRPYSSKKEVLVVRDYLFDSEIYLLEKETIMDVYNKLCDYCRNKNGSVNADFDDPAIIRRGKEWIDIHHIREIDSLDNIAVRTKEALKLKDFETLNKLKPLNKKEQLIYCDKVEHFLLHYLIDIYRGEHVFSGGCWAIFSGIFDMEHHPGFKMPYLAELQKNKDKLYDQQDYNLMLKMLRNMIDIRRRQWDLSQDAKRVYPEWWLSTQIYRAGMIMCYDYFYFMLVEMRWPEAVQCNEFAFNKIPSLQPKLFKPKVESNSTKSMYFVSLNKLD